MADEQSLIYLDDHSAEENGEEFEGDTFYPSVMEGEDAEVLSANTRNEPVETIEIGDFFQCSKLLPPAIRNFQSREELLKHVQSFSLLQGYATTIRDSKKDKYVTIGCDRGGIYRNRMKTPVEERKRKTCSRLIDCPFRIKGMKLSDGSWVLKIENASHNHEASSDMSGHPYCRRLSNEEILRVKELSKSGIAPRQLLTSLRQTNPSLKAISKTIYNTKGKLRKEELRGRTPIQALLEELSKGGFTYNYECDAENRLTHLFIAHPLSIRLSKSYSNIFVMDCTYKTNRFKMPLLDIIGVSSFNTSFYSCFAFLSKEKEGDYVWALNMFKKMLGTKEPAVIVSDRELALMNGIEVVFPRTRNLLCVWHIEKNILANCKKLFVEEKDWDTFLSQWTTVTESDSETSFNRAWEEFEVSYQKNIVAINYIKNTWLPFKEYFIKAWTETHLHFGNRVTSRAEGAHGVLKQYLQVSTNNLLLATEKICLAVENNFLAIKTQLASEKIRRPHNICVPFFKELVHCVSVFALEKLYKQYQMAISDSALHACKGNFQATMGLPCAHMMRTMKNGVLNISDIHPQWRIDVRSFEDDIVEPNGDKLKVLFGQLEERYHEWPISCKEATEKQLQQLVNSSQPIVFDPIIQTPKGRPFNSKTKKSSTSTTRDPSAFELVDKSRKCSNCKGVGHNCRTCPRLTMGDNVEFHVPNPVESQSISLDLNSLPVEFFI